MTDAAKPAACSHCWHQWGIGSGSMSSDGSGHSAGQDRCCHCGDVKSWEYRIEAQKPIQHGPFYSEILIHV